MIVDERTKRRFDSNWVPEPNTGCFLWIKSRHDRGYGPQLITDIKMGRRRSA